MDLNIDIDMSQMEYGIYYSRGLSWTEQSDPLAAGYLLRGYEGGLALPHFFQTPFTIST